MNKSILISPSNPHMRILDENIQINKFKIYVYIYLPIHEWDNVHTFDYSEDDRKRKLKKLISYIPIYKATEVWHRISPILRIENLIKLYESISYTKLIKLSEFPAFWKYITFLYAYFAPTAKIKTVIKIYTANKLHFRKNVSQLFVFVILYYMPHLYCHFVKY